MKPISQITLKFGESADAPPLSLEPTGITIFVGPNNSGKSLVLREIETFCSTGSIQNGKILESVKFNVPEPGTVRSDLEEQEASPTKDEIVPQGSIVVQRLSTYRGLKAREIVRLDQVDQWVQGSNLSPLTRYYFSFLTVRLDASTRTTLLAQQGRGDLLAPPTNILTALFVNPAARERIRNLTREAFGKFFTIDPTSSNHLRARLSDRPPADELEEQALDARARAFHRAAVEIGEASDGVKAFTGMIATVLGRNYRIPLIDEPEAFLHPPLARRLGKELSLAAAERDANIICATHSADFVMGCVAGGTGVNIVRLTFTGGKASARLLQYQRLNEIIRSPLMRSTGVLSALFHEGAVVCEGDSDRALYQEVNDRLAQAGQPAAEALFLNAHSKQATAKIAGPLREMGIPAAVVVDFDILKPNDDFKHLLRDLRVPSALAASWCQSKALIAQHVVNEGIDWKAGGLSAIGATDMVESANNLIENLKAYGIFVVPNGELETWLAYLGMPYTSNKQQWLLDIFDRLGTDMGDPACQRRNRMSHIWRR